FRLSSNKRNMKRAILTGFEPFGPYEGNPVQDTAKEYNGKRIGDIEVAGIVLPSTYYGAFDVLSDEIDRLGPDMILGTGLASSVRRIKLEAVGENIMKGKYADANDYRPEGVRIAPKGKDFYRTNADNISLAYCLSKNGIPAEVSVDAEGFICNSLIYLTARRIEKENLPVRHAFFHTPWTQDYLGRVKLEEGKTTISKDELRRAIDLCLLGMAQG
ncbi:MAG: hypothetical protein NTY20_05480, partial [Candidatus Aenigmarchaeota archaeon]|nr:hypothetical protein [Candidatus Aenigmarchaeota archaeon]